jgi:hypothetical protein
MNRWDHRHAPLRFEVNVSSFGGSYEAPWTVRVPSKTCLASDLERPGNSITDVNVCRERLHSNRFEVNACCARSMRSSRGGHTNAS